MSERAMIPSDRLNTPFLRVNEKVRHLGTGEIVNAVVIYKHDNTFQAANGHIYSLFDFEGYKPYQLGDWMRAA